MSAPENPPAFPPPIHPDCGDARGWPMGLTMRDWFAGQALPCAAEAVRPGVDIEAMAKAVAKVSYALADAMLEARAASFNDRGQS